MQIPRTPHYNRVLEFMLRAKQECPLFPTMPASDVRRLRATLILEEALEAIHGLGVSVMMPGGSDVEMKSLSFVCSHEPNLVDIVDGCADLSVVTVGTLIACGVKDAPVLECVDENNLAKFRPGYSIRGDGKLIKPPGHQPPAIQRVLNEQMPAEPIQMAR